jgi:hypothetical protein
MLALPGWKTSALSPLQGASFIAGLALASGVYNMTLMAAIIIPESVQAYFPRQIEPSQLWVNYNAEADSLTIYFTGNPVPSVWEDIDQYAYLGFSLDDENVVTGVMIEHFSKWLVTPDRSQQQLQQT